MRKSILIVLASLLLAISCPAGIIIVDPNGGEELISGQTETISWDTVGDINNVKIEFSDSNGQTWADVNSSIPNNGSYNWLVPEVTSQNCLVRVSDVNNSDVNDTSGDVFTIYQCQLFSFANLDNDCDVDFVDFSIFALDWLRNGNPFDENYTEPLPIIWVYIDDPGVSGHESFTGEMSKYETTNTQYCQFLNAALASGDVTVSGGIVYGANGSNGGADFVGEAYFDTYAASSDSQITYSGGTFSVRSRDGYDMSNHPVVEVSWYGATAFCNYYGYRLPTEWEWQAVADFDGSYTYGCGTSIDQSKANYWDIGYANPLVLSDMPYTSPVNHYPSYGYGMNDMAGNVQEWTSTVYGISRVMRGGSWGLNDYYCTVSYQNLYFNPDSTYFYYGFRVCR